MALRFRWVELEASRADRTQGTITAVDSSMNAHLKQVKVTVGRSALDHLGL